MGKIWLEMKFTFAYICISIKSNPLLTIKLMCYDNRFPT